MQAHVDEELRQKFDWNSAQKFSAVHNVFPDCDDYRVKYLYHSSGDFSNLVALYNGPRLAIVRTFSQLPVWLRYTDHDPSAIIVDVAYLPSKENVCGLIVAINSPSHGARLSYLTTVNGNLKQLYSIPIGNQITCILVAIGNQEMIGERERLNQRMAKWDNIVLCGTQECHCFLLTFPMDEANLSDKSTDCLKRYHVDRDRFSYQAYNEQKMQVFKKEDIAVTSLGFIHLSRDLIIGMSFGGLVTISLSEMPCIKCLRIPLSAPVRHIATLQPDDDPRWSLWFWVFFDPPARAIESSRPSALTMVLFQGGVLEDEHLPLRERSFQNPNFIMQLMHRFSGKHWIHARTITRDRPSVARGDDTAMEQQLIPALMKERALTFFAFKTKDNRVKAGMFDLNAYYYKRMCGDVIADQTLAQQCPFLSVIWPNSGLEFEAEIDDLAIDADFLSRFYSNVSEAEQMFYPSNYEISRLFVGTRRAHFVSKVPSLMGQFMQSMSTGESLYRAVENGKKTASFILALGLLYDPALNGQEPFNIIMTAAIVYRFHYAIVEMLEKTASSDPALLIRVNDWLWQEIQLHRSKFDEISQPLFSRSSGYVLTSSSSKSLCNSITVFSGAVTIYKTLQKMLSSFGEDVDVPSEVTVECKLRLSAAHNLFEMSKFIKRLIDISLLPLSSQPRGLRTALNNFVRDRKNRAALDRRHLFIDELVGKMRKLAPTENLWKSASTDWYPPTLYTLSCIIPIISIAQKSKAQLITYYMFDYVLCRDFQNTNTLTPDEGLRCRDIVLSYVDNLLDISLEFVENVYQLWINDGEFAHINETPLRISRSPLLSLNKRKLKLYLEEDKVLNPEEEADLKGILADDPYGQFKFQVYLIRRGRYTEVQDLPLPPNSSNPAVMAYSGMIEIVRQRRSEDERLMNERKAALCLISDDVQKMITEGLHNECSVDPEIKPATRQMPKTPMPLWSRVSRIKKPPTSECEVNEEQILVNETADTMDESRAIQQKSSMTFTSPANSIMDVPSEVVERIKDVLRTPTSRFTMADESSILDTTPETPAPVMLPTSILKSGKGKETTPRRNVGGIRFNITGELSESIASDTAPLPQPNFDIDDETEVVESGVEEQSNGSCESEDVDSNEGEITEIGVEHQEEREELDPQQEEHSDVIPIVTEPDEDEDVPLNEQKNEPSPEMEILERGEEMQDDDSLPPAREEVKVPQTLYEVKDVEAHENLHDEKVVDETFALHSGPSRTNLPVVDNDKLIIKENNGNGKNSASFVDETSPDKAEKKRRSRELVHGTWDDENGVHHSFEQQPDSDGSDSDEDNGVNEIEMIDPTSSSTEKKDAQNSPIPENKQDPVVPEQSTVTATFIVSAETKAVYNSSLGPLDRSRSRGRPKRVAASPAVPSNIDNDHSVTVEETSSQKPPLRPRQSQSPTRSLRKRISSISVPASEPVIVPGSDVTTVVPVTNTTLSTPTRRGRKPKETEAVGTLSREQALEPKEPSSPSRKGRKPKETVAEAVDIQEKVAEIKERSSPSRRGRKQEAMESETSSHGEVVEHKETLLTSEQLTKSKQLETIEGKERKSPSRRNRRTSEIIETEEIPTTSRRGRSRKLSEQQPTTPTKAPTLRSLSGTRASTSEAMSEVVSRTPRARRGTSVNSKLSGTESIPQSSSRTVVEPEKTEQSTTNLVVPSATRRTRSSSISASYDINRQRMNSAPPQSPTRSLRKRNLSENMGTAVEDKGTKSPSRKARNSEVKDTPVTPRRGRSAKNQSEGPVVVVPTSSRSRSKTSVREPSQESQTPRSTRRTTQASTSESVLASKPPPSRRRGSTEITKPLDEEKVATPRRGRAPVKVKPINENDSASEIRGKRRCGAVDVFLKSMAEKEAKKPVVGRKRASSDSEALLAKAPKRNLNAVEMDSIPEAEEAASGSVATPRLRSSTRSSSRTRATESTVSTRSSKKK